MEKHKKESEFDNETFFEEYAKMARSVDGLEAAGEWHQLRPPGARGQNRSGSRLRLRLALPLCR